MPLWRTSKVAAWVRDPGPWDWRRRTSSFLSLAERFHALREGRDALLAGSWPIHRAAVTRSVFSDLYQPGTQRNDSSYSHETHSEWLTRGLREEQLPSQWTMERKQQ